MYDACLKLWVPPRVDEVSCLSSSDASLVRPPGKNWMRPEPTLAVQRIRGFTTMHYINRRFTYLLTYLRRQSYATGSLSWFYTLVYLKRIVPSPFEQFREITN